MLVLGLLALLGLAGLLACCCHLLHPGEKRLPEDVEAQKEMVLPPTLDLEAELGRSFMKHSVTKHLMPTCSSEKAKAEAEAEEFSRMRDASDKKKGRQETVVNTVFLAQAEDFYSRTEMVDGESVEVEVT